MLFRALAIWCGLLSAAFFNGALREMWLMPVFGDPVAHLVSAAILSAIVVAVAWAAIVWLHPHSANEALLIGDEWVLLTIAFEFLAGYYLFGTPWQTLLAQYDVSQGQPWELVSGGAARFPPREKRASGDNHRGDYLPSPARASTHATWGLREIGLR
jgi:hypothetical protein